MTHCLCNHNTFYGSSFFVMPNPIDLSQTGALFATINKNFVVAAVLGGFFFLYLILVVWARYADKKAQRTVRTTSVIIWFEIMVMLTRERNRKRRKERNEKALFLYLFSANSCCWRTIIPVPIITTCWIFRQETGNMEELRPRCVQIIQLGNRSRNKNLPLTVLFFLSFFNDWVI